jgi:hypothetical protein
VGRRRRWRKTLPLLIYITSFLPSLPPSLPPLLPPALLVKGPIDARLGVEESLLHQDAVVLGLVLDRAEGGREGRREGRTG